MIYIALLALWLVVWLVSALLARSAADRAGYDADLFFRYGLLAGPWAYLAAKNASAYDIAIPSSDEPALLESERTSSDDGAPLALEERTVELVRSDDEQSEYVEVDDAPIDVAGSDDTDQDDQDDTERDDNEHHDTEHHDDLPDPDPQHVAEMESVLAAEAAAIEAMLRGEETVPVVDPFAEVEPEPEEVVEPEESQGGWTSRSGERSTLNLADFGDIDKPVRVRGSKVKPVEETIVEPATVESEEESPKSGGLLGRLKRGRTTSDETKSVDIPTEAVEEPVALLPISDATVPETATAGTCTICKRASYADWHGLCDRCGEVWQPLGKR